ncbi:Pirin-domain-containing protein [Fomitiporia mediterranea MF3/22]|uniref:Pirin-domain-containing protein n=1 Tax=Fomitiporia mediterranea (strain MF3/22) TaxID=694068 RepID=UPI0004408820|nr:Pirin-domain-containing protein [Fomitiporia mediterranea MF3/22]EJD07579.1 Pirin-domain-containing protein [Fomitiporia mediterranea MF3/22]
MAAATGVKIVPRRSTERGHADHDWLKTFHTFSFAMYQDPEHMQFGSLRVINEDRVKPRTGFGTHSHREFEIFSYVVSGELEHKDSMNNTEILKRGDLQLTSAGSPGISHSEKCHGSLPVHFLQIWTLPWKAGLPAKYFTRHFTDEEKKDTWCRVVAPVGAEGVLSEVRDGDGDGKGPAPVQSPVTLFASLLSPGTKLPSAFPEKVYSTNKDAETSLRKKYIHVVQTSGYNPNDSAGASVRVASGEKDKGAVEEVFLREGDGAYIFGEKGKVLEVENVGDRVAEVLLFDVE